MRQTIAFWTKHWLSKNKISFYFAERAESSNDLAKDQAFKGANSPTAFLTAKQSRGRGQAGKKWEDSDLMISFLWEENLKKITEKSQLDFALDLQKALKAVWPDLPLRVKAPNDLYLGRGKAGGILLEALSQGSKKALIAGLGLNVFSSPEHAKAACLAEQAQDIAPGQWESFLGRLLSLWSERACYQTG